MIPKRFKFVIHALTLLLTLTFISWLKIPQIKASPDIFQGDLILTSNNVTTIEGRFDINGSIIVENNATLILRNAVVNFTQTSEFQFSMIFQNPAYGKPRLQTENATIISGYRFYIGFYNDSSADAYELDSPISILATHDSSFVSISNSTINGIECLDNSFVEISYSAIYFGEISGSSSIELSNCTISYLDLYESSSATLSNSSVSTMLSMQPSSVNCSIVDLPTGFTSSWNYHLNCSIEIGAEGHASNLTLRNTQISNWKLLFRGSSNVTIRNSEIEYLFGVDSSNMNVMNSDINVVYTHHSSNLSVSNSTINHIKCYDFGRVNVMDLTLTSLLARHSSRVWLVNSTSDTYYVEDQSEVYAGWYLGVHVIDSISQDVPSANVTAYYPNATKADSRLTDVNGLTRLILMEKMMNTTGEYPFGNYTVEAKYGVHSADTTINMTGNQQAILTLESFVIPEFPSFLILPLFMAATLLVAIIIRKRKHLLAQTKRIE